jgi:hypothetical protein
MGIDRHGAMTQVAKPLILPRGIVLPRENFLLNLIHENFMKN